MGWCACCVFVGVRGVLCLGGLLCFACVFGQVLCVGWGWVCFCMWVLGLMGGVWVLGVRLFFWWWGVGGLRAWVSGGGLLGNVAVGGLLVGGGFVSGVRGCWRGSLVWAAVGGLACLVWGLCWGLGGVLCILCVFWIVVGGGGCFWFLCVCSCLVFGRGFISHSKPLREISMGLRVCNAVHGGMVYIVLAVMPGRI